MSRTISGKKMPLWAREERPKLGWPALEFMQRKNEATSDELEHHLLGFTTSTNDQREQRYEGGLTVWRNLVSWIVVDLSWFRCHAIEPLEKDMPRPGGGTMGRYRVTSEGLQLTERDFTWR
jgi:hypothetical protein